MESFVTAFKRIGLDAKVISSLSKSSKKASKCIFYVRHVAIVTEAIKEAGASNGCDKTKGNLMYVSLRYFHV